MKPVKIEIDLDTADGIVRAALSDHLECLKNPKFKSKHKADIAYEKKIIKHIEAVLDYYGGPPNL